MTELTLVLNWSVSFPVRTETGTIAVSDSDGSASWPIRYRRRAEAHRAITTSFTVTPKARFTVCASLSRSVR